MTAESLFAGLRPIVPGGLTLVIRVCRVRAETPSPLPAASLPLRDKPSIAVLAFQNMSGDRKREYFAGGKTATRWLAVMLADPNPATFRDSL